MMAKKRAKAPVTERALIQRCNRRLADQEQTLCKWRSAGNEQGQDWQAGDLYLVSLRANTIENFNVDLAALAREIDCLREWEELVD
jgi:hypothetical protein